MKVLMILSILSLAACGAGGAPIRPTGTVGLSFDSNGVSPSATVGATNGPVTLSVGL